MIPRPPSTGRYAPRTVTRALIPRDDGSPAFIDGGDPRDRVPNANEPLGSTGPNVAPGFGDTHVMYPAGGWHAEAWQGWPVGWQTPLLEQTPTHSTFFGYGTTDPAGYLKRVSTVGTCVDKQSRQLASFPAYGVRNGAPVDLPEWYRRSPEPLLYADWGEFVKALVNSLLLAGETILYATGRFAPSSGGLPARFMALDPAEVHIPSAEEDDAGEYFIGDEHVDRADICHIRYQRDPGATFRGIGPIGWVGRDLVDADALSRYASNIAAYGVSAVLIAPGEMTAKQIDDARAQWMASRRAFPGVPAMVSGGAQYQPLSLSPRDMALLDLKVFDLQLISSAFGVPPGLVGLPQAAGGLAYSSPAMLTDLHWRDGLRPLASTVAPPLGNWLLPRGTGLEFNPDRYTQPSLELRAPAWATLHAIVETDPETGLEKRAVTVDEIRTFERWAPYTDDMMTTPNPAAETAMAGQIGTPRG